MSTSFANWTKRTKIDTRMLLTGMRRAWPLYEAPEISLMTKVKRVKEEKRKGLYGSSRIGSKVIALNPRTLRGDAVMWATSALHEAEHGVNKADDEEAPTRREFRFLGKLYKRGVNTNHRTLATKAVKAAYVAMRQRQRMVEKAKRTDDRGLLIKSGFSERAANFILGGGKS